MRGRCVRAGMGIAAVVWAAATAAAQCPREWARGFEVPGLDGPAYALLVYDDGTGPALHVGGDFYDAGTAASLGVARWDGRGWSPVGTPSIPQYVHALIGFDDGSGVALYSGYQFWSVSLQERPVECRWLCAIPRACVRRI